MRIALYMDAPYIGGAERNFRDLSGGLAQAGHEVHVLCPSEILPPYLSALGDAITVHALGPRLTFSHGLLRNVMLSGRPVLELRARLRDIDAQILHICNGGYPAAHMARAAVFATSAPRVMTVNNRARERRQGMQAIDAALDRAVWRALSSVVCPSQATADRLRSVRGVPEPKLHVIPYGIPPPDFELVEVARLRGELAPRGELLVGMVVAPDPSGEHARHKGHRVLLEALAATGRNDVRAVVIGHDPGPSFLTRARELGISDRVVLLLGFRDVRPYMAAFDVLTVPSERDEAMPLVILEAMASETPVVASRLSGIPEVVIDGSTGYVVPPGDVRALSARLAQCAEDRSTLAALAAGARRIYEQEFSIETMVVRYLKVYEAAVGDADGPGSPPELPAAIGVTSGTPR